MANAVFTTKVNPVYDDLPELRYHFPKTYLNQAKESVGSFIIYYEPRREGKELSGRAGRQCYFATARVDRLEPDPKNEGHYYAFMTDYLEFTHPVPFREGDFYFESNLRKEDGSTNKGRFGRSIRTIASVDYELIIGRGFPNQKEDYVRPDEKVNLEIAYDVKRESRTRLVTRTFRDRKFTTVIQEAYHKACAMTGLSILNAKGDCEVEAAHIKPVKDNGPDSPRNGIALTSSIHWMFDEGLFSISDEGEILVFNKLVPDKIRRLLNPDGRIFLPNKPDWKPHSIFLKYHREKVYKGN